MTLSDLVARHARERPDAPAYVSPDECMTWREYDERAARLAGVLGGLGLERGSRVAVILRDGPAVHTAFVAIERAGLVIVGIGPRAGDREIEHLITRTAAQAWITDAEHAPLAARLGIPVVAPDSRTVAMATASAPNAPIAADEVWLLNSTSGTTGLPKCVVHDQQRWFAFHDFAVAAADLDARDVFMSVLPAPFGFGIWTAHVTPTVVGAPTVVMPRFDATLALELIQRERVTVLAAVSTQFVMLLNAPDLAEYDLSSLRVLFTGGEMVPYHRAAEFEERTGCTVLQFYGSNETGALSRTTLDDPRERRLRTTGRVLPEMHVRLFSEDGVDVTASGGPGIAACKGPVNCRGYYDDPEANARLYTADGWMLTGDFCTIDAEGYLTVSGRASDFIIRGGKNISAAQVEDEVSSHPAVALAAAVATPDAVFGERVCAYVELHPGAALDLDALREHLAARGVGKELWPERLVILDALPRASGGKVAKGALRDHARALVDTASGRLEGARIGVGDHASPSGVTVLRFLGIPYAAPPVAEARFRAPRPAEPWAGIRAAHAFGPAAPQGAGVRSRLPSFSVADTDEDCLTLNVWTPATTGRRPVLVWLHGGAYLSGGSAMGVFDGARLAAEGDCVVVTANYRLGALGYLAVDPDEDGDANCGLRDQVAALAWVHEHADAFGGDADRITVFGESAGAGSILHLMALRDPPAVRRAIVQSGEPRTLATDLAHQVRAALVRHLGIAPGLDALRAAPVDALLAAQDAVFAELGSATGLMPFHPCFDQLVDVDPIAGAGAGRGRDIDLVIGNTRDELRLFADPRARDLDDAGLARLVARLGGPGTDPDAVLAAYRRDDPERAPGAIWEAARTDAVLRVPALRVADAHTRAGGATFVYRFDWEAPGIGAAHAVDVPFTFGTFDRDGWGEAVGADARAHALSRDLRAAWVAFAHTGDPSHGGIGTWPAHDPETRPTLLLASPCRVALDPAGEARAVWGDEDAVGESGSAEPVGS
jgi:acyl-CoA synthetase